MARSLHTDPYAIRAARRVAAPWARRFDPRAVRRGGTATPPSVRRRLDIGGRPARPGFVHPAGERDIARLIDLLGPRAAYGLRRVELCQAVGPDRPGHRLAALLVPGVILLYEQPRPPWTIIGRLMPESERRLVRAGGRLEVAPGLTRVDWPGETLRDLMLFDGLAHEVGHHIAQHGRPRARAMRTVDHERRADAFADACRRAWTAW